MLKNIEEMSSMIKDEETVETSFNVDKVVEELDKISNESNETNETNESIRESPISVSSVNMENKKLKRKVIKKEIKPSINKTCQICEDKYNKSNRLHVCCPYCEYEACRECQRTYILSVNIPQCMNCHKEWSRKIMVDKFTRVFIDTELKEKRKQLLFDKERSLMPGTQPIVERKKYATELRKIKQKIEKKIRDLQILQSLYEWEEYEIKINNAEYLLPIEEINDETIVKVREERKIKKKAVAGEAQESQQTKSHQHVFVRACPAEGCRGFLSTRWKCGICDKWTCPECHEVKGINQDAEHECKQENIESAKLLSKETKPCPKCASNIFKIDGCDQIWCTQCHTAFSWKTGKIETNVHNPHYFEYMRRKGIQDRNPLDIQCGREMDNNFITNMYNNLKNLSNDTENPDKIYGGYNRYREPQRDGVYDYNGNYVGYTNRYGVNIGGQNRAGSAQQLEKMKTQEEKIDSENQKKIIEFNNKLYEMCRNLIHIREVELPPYVANRNEMNNEDIRIKYLLNEINENDMKVLLVQRDKFTDKNRELTNIINMFLTCATEIIYRFDAKVKEMIKLKIKGHYIKPEITYFTPHLLNAKKNIPEEKKGKDLLKEELENYYYGIYVELQIEEYENELKGLVEYANDNFSEVAHVYKVKEYKFDEINFKMN